MSTLLTKRKQVLRLTPKTACPYLMRFDVACPV